MKRLLTLSLCLAAAVTALAQSRAERILRELRNPESEYVIVISHRGDWRNYPENSLEAIESAINMGVDIVEMDIHRTADGVLVLCHDKTINRTTNGKGKISEITYDSIRRCCLRSEHGVGMPKYRMPTLAEALDLCRNRVMINIDKGYDYYDQILPMLEERDMVEQVIIKDKKSPDKVAAKLAAHERNMIYMPIINYTAQRWDKHSELFEAYLASDIRPLAYEMCWDGTLKGHQKQFDRVLKSGARLWVNTLWDSLCGGEKHGYEDDRAVKNPDAVYGGVLKMGVTMIQTDRPALLIGYLDEKGRHTLK
ncbi:MAG: glycerophosphodiester phosphodiesterase family protein [Alistipes sp.]